MSHVQAAEQALASIARVRTAVQHISARVDQQDRQGSLRSRTFSFVQDIGPTGAVLQRLHAL